jgi:hypothetical protein
MQIGRVTNIRKLKLKQEYLLSVMLSNERLSHARSATYRFRKKVP